MDLNARESITRRVVTMNVLTKSLAPLAVSALMAVPVTADAAAVRFDATGVAGVEGFVVFDDSLFDGTVDQFLPNTAILDLSMNVFGALFSLVDVVTGDGTIMNSIDAIPVIVNGAGNLADNGVTAISFFPDGSDGTAFDGDASLGVGVSGFLAEEDFYAVSWEFAGVVTPVPLPAGLPLLLAGLGGLALLRRRKHAA
jgi:hypothetical protein